MLCCGLCHLYYRKQPEVCAGNGCEGGLQLPYFLLCVSCADNYSLPRCELLSLRWLNYMPSLGRILQAPTDKTTVAFTGWSGSHQKISYKNIVSLS